MTLPRDVARCHGDASDECADCARRAAAMDDKQSPPRWPAWWIVPPIQRPCAERIEMEVIE